MSNSGLTVDESNNFMALEPHLVELARAAVAGMRPAVQVLTVSDLAGVAESAQHTPAIHIVYGGYRVAEDYGLTVSLEHTWFAVAAVRNVAKARSGSAARQDAGSLLARVTEVFLGARVQGATKPLALITPPAASYSAGFQYIPSAFLAETIFRKKQPQ